MGILDLLSKEGRADAKSRWEYEECYRARQEKLLSFRKNAFQEITFKYPDARLLLNRLDNRFIVSVKSAGKLLVGVFADEYYPRLDFVGDAASTHERSEAVARFRNEVSSCSGTISKQKMHYFEGGVKWIGDKARESFQSRGFAITGATKLEYLIGGALFLNERMIAKASIWDPEPKPKGYFSTKIFEEVLQDRDNRPGTRALVFVTRDLDGGEQGQKMCYRFLFDRSLLCLNENSRKEFEATILGLRDFMYDIEEYFRPNDRGWEFEWVRHAAAELESPDRDDDQSIEGRYIL